MDDIQTDTEEANNNGATGGENISDSGCWVVRTEEGSGVKFSRVESI